MRYKAIIAEGASIGDAKSEIEVCGGTKLEVVEEGTAITFEADVNDIPGLEGMASIQSVVELQGEDADERGIYRGLRLV